MGIRCTCPNGHRLNLKAFLAGKRGVCPHCGESFRIPEESESAPTPLAEAGGAAAAAQNDVAAQPTAEAPTAPQPFGARPVAPQPVAAQPVAAKPVSAKPVSAKPVAAQPVAAKPVVAPAARPLAADASPPTPAPSPAPPATSDPISELPNAVWYVRPATGGQYGPAPGATMRHWVDEGRVTPDSYVWREDWPDWKLAEGMFDRPEARRGAVEKKPNADAPRKRAKSNTVSIVMLAVLALLSIASLVVLAIVLRT